jgi:hypothetical protein
VVGRRPCGLLDEAMVDVWKKVWWIIGRGSGEWLEEDLVNG